MSWGRVLKYKYELGEWDYKINNSTSTGGRV